MKPKSLRSFDRLFPLAVVVSLIASMLGFAALERAARVGLGQAGAAESTAGIGMVVAALLIFVLLAAVLWTSVSVMRMGWMRYVLALVVAYTLYRSLIAFGVLGIGLGTLLDLLAALIAAFATALLFRPDARAWFAEYPDDDGDDGGDVDGDDTP